jgi:D-alanyl-D-alanine carboxypeptidase (penicillin-binding protein 5/6)
MSFQKNYLLRLFQNFSFWNSFLRFNRKTGPLAGFLKSLSIEPEVRTNRVLEQALLTFFFFCALSPLSLRALDPAADAPGLKSQAAALIDAATGTLLYLKNADQEIPPASLTKLMTIHIALSEAAAGRASLDETVPLPPGSWAISQPPRSSLMFLAQGQRVSLRELLLGLAVSSGNDAAAAVALRFAPGIAEFAELMNREARNLGLSKTRFTEPSGISENNVTTAREFALFCAAYLNLHPEAVKEFHSVRKFAYPKVSNVAEAYREKPGTIVQYNRNTLLGKFEGADGLKTGYIDEAGYNIALTAERQGTRLAAVILGAPAAYGGDRIRDDDGNRLLTWGFNNFKTVRPETGELPPARIWKGKNNTAAVRPGEALVFTAYTDRAGILRWETELEDPLVAPLPAGSLAGSLVFYDEAGELRRVPLVIAEAAEQGGLFKRLWDGMRLFFREIFS